MPIAHVFGKSFRDSLALYPTAKIVRVRETKLRVIELAFRVGILLYMLIKLIVIDQAYYTGDTATGVAQRQKLHTQTAPVTVDYRALNYCMGSYVGTDRWTLKFPLEGFPCRVWDNEMFEDLVRLNQAFVPTHVDEAVQIYQCGQENNATFVTEHECTQPYVYEPGSFNSYFIADPMRASVNMYHVFQAQTFHRQYPKSKQYSGYSGQFHGKLVDQNDNVLLTFPPGDHPDFIPLAKLLEAVNVRFDDISPHSSVKGSVLHEGLLLKVFIDYSNRDGDTSYTYRVEIDSPGYGATTVVPEEHDFRGKRRAYLIQGVMILFQITGDFVRFDFQNLLVQLLSTSVLLSLASVMTDFVMLNLLPDRDMYLRAKFEDTEDFQLLREQQSQLNEHLIQECNNTLAGMRADPGFEMATRNVYASR